MMQSINLGSHIIEHFTADENASDNVKPNHVFILVMCSQEQGQVVSFVYIVAQTKCDSSDPCWDGSLSV